ncbi:hypothetical protein Slin_7001 (plasmid) [Spirosoma linguale DSM 74]|uniref:Uncharacterized protein n=1 Tax=Spirosoma linguale (strain ATCC 33905 / DSM 74 / LMG 10896 / Claus 1) TaxID=504472 RepID=D2QVW2_SPILD|nr:hypothetical protein Slin_7001 [Spirosoma linguale DSM 74]
MIRPQYVYRATDFVFGNGGKPKPKYFVVFHIDADSILLLSLTTSKSKLPANLDDDASEGCVYYNDGRGYGHAFVWKPDRAVGTNGFCFPLRTYVQFEFRSQLYMLSSSEINSKATHTIDECCCLLDDEFIRILECLIGSRYLNGRQKRDLQSRVNALKK